MQDRVLHRVLPVQLEVLQLVLPRHVRRRRLLLPRSDPIPELSPLVPRPVLRHVHHLQQRHRVQPLRVRLRYPYSFGRDHLHRCPSAEARIQDSPGTCSRRRWCWGYKPVRSPD